MTAVLAVVLIMDLQFMQGVRLVKRRNIEEGEPTVELAAARTNASEQSSHVRPPYLRNVYFSHSSNGASEGDVRAGSGGAYIYPFYQWTSNAADAITGFTLVRGGSGASCPAGFNKIHMDLNKGAGGSYNYLCFTKNRGSSPVTEITFLKFGGSYGGLHWHGWFVHPQDLLESGGGKYVYVAYKLAKAGPGCLKAYNSQTASQTAWDAAWTRTAPTGMVITDISSHHDNGREDRVWTFGYSTVAPLSFLDEGSHTWTGQTGWHASWSLNCPNGAVTSGFKSHHSNHLEDRVWSMRCTKLRLDAWNGAPGTVYTRQQVHNKTDLNGFDRHLNFRRQDGHTETSEMIIGISSYYSGAHRDRRFSIVTARHCKL